jgi:hypothetical protein
VWLIILSDQLRIVALVGRYPANKLIRHRLIQSREVLRSPAFTPHLSMRGRMRY